MGKISIVGLGPGDYSLISQGALELLQSSNRIFLRTEKHPTVDQLKQQIDYTSLDYFYEKEENFENVYLHISKFIIDESKKGFSICSSWTSKGCRKDGRNNRKFS